MTRSTRQELSRQHAPRSLLGEPRLSIADEQQLTDRVRMHERQARETAAQEELERLEAERQEVVDELAALPPGNRDLRRELREQIRQLQRSIDRLEDRPRR